MPLRRRLPAHRFAHGYCDASERLRPIAQPASQRGVAQRRSVVMLLNSLPKGSLPTSAEIYHQLPHRLASTSANPDFHADELAANKPQLAIN